MTELTTSRRDPGNWNADEHHQGRIAAMIELAQATANRTLDYFGDPSLKIDRKGDTTPVTEADKNAENLFRQQLDESFPQDSVIGEEFDNTDGTSGYRWIVDPIDGTKSFICGVPLYSTLVGLEHHQKMLGGAIVIPALNQLLIAVSGFGAWYRKEDPLWHPAHVSDCSELTEAVFVTSQVDTFAERGAGHAYLKLESTASITRSWGDGYGYFLVATGRADIMIDPIVNAWDVAAIFPVIDEAGGRFTDWQGKQTIYSGDALGTNGRLHDQVLQLLNEGPLEP